MPVIPMRFSRLPLLFLVAAGCVSLCGCWGKGEEKLPKIGRASLIDCGGKLLRIPPPPEMIRSDGIHKEWDRILAKSLPPEQQLLGYYTTFEDRLMIERQSPPASDRDCTLHIRTKDIDRDHSSWGLGGLENDIDDEIDQVTKDLANQFALILAAGADIDIDPELETPPGAKGALLGWFGETRHSFGYSVAIEVPTGEGATAGSVSLVTSTVVALVSGRMISFQATSVENGEKKGRQWAEKTASTWSELAVSANVAYKPPSWIWRGIKLLLFVALIYGLFRGGRRLIQLKRELDKEVAEEKRRDAARIEQD
ncbi:MAG: hypothetical protein ACI9R3_004598 [Verrucomicrobiales bacterium]|jgi:hypothetical protein